MAVTIASGLLAQILDQADRTREQEICGLLLGNDHEITQIMPAMNRAEDPARRFEIDPGVLFAAHKAVRAGGAAILGHYHSHPNGFALPSEYDREQGRGGELWMIVARGGAALFRFEGAAFCRIALQTR